MEHLFPIQHSYLIPLLPLAGAIIAGFFCTAERKKFAHWPIWIGVLCSAVLSIMLLVQFWKIQPSGVAEHGHVQFTFGVVKSFFTWIEAGTFKIMAGFWFDPLTAVMLCVVCGIGFLITVYSAGYMKGEAGYFRFFAFLGLFIFMMTILVMGENLVMLYLGWEGVGLCSYLLVGYYYEKPSARDAAKKAFIVNRVGDFGFAIGIMLTFYVFGTVSYFGEGTKTFTGFVEMMANPSSLPGMTPFKLSLINWIPFCLMLGAFGKSAQFPLYVWLPDAMEGPTPVSALIHAATMVTAGVYMIARCGALFVGNHAAITTVAVIGAFSAIFAALIAIRQFDLKKVFAYSTISQLGYMIAGLGVLAPVAGVFHLVTHAFFKALLFLCSGVVMHAMAGELDMRKMSGLKHVLPKTRILILIGCLALSGFPFFSGFFSKDEIIGAAWEHSKLLGGVLLLAAFLTAYYTFRLYFRVFEGPEVLPVGVSDGHARQHHEPAHEEPADDESHLRIDEIHRQAKDAVDAPPPVATHDAHAHHDHEPALMIWPLIVLAFGALFAGYINFPFEKLGHFLGQSPSLAIAFDLASMRYNNAATGEIVSPVPFGHLDERPAEYHEREQQQHLYMMITSGLISALGILIAYQMHLKDRASEERLAARAPMFVRLLDHKFWVDEVYQKAFVEPLRGIGRGCVQFDRWVIDGALWTISFIPQLSGFVLKLTTQRGYLQGYGLAMILGIAVILLVIFT